jgi:hypothetical protein
LTDVFLITGIILEKKGDTFPSEDGSCPAVTPPERCRLFMYLSMSAQWCVWLFGVIVGVNTWLLLTHNIVWRERLQRFQYLAWIVALLIPLPAFRVKKFDACTLFCYPDLDHSAGPEGFEMIMWSESLFILMLMTTFCAYIGGFIRATKNSTEAVVAKQGQRVLWVLLMVGTVWSSYLLVIPWVVQRKPPPKALQELWLVVSPLQGFANAVLYIKLRWMPELKRRGDNLGHNRKDQEDGSGAVGHRERGAVAFESMDCVYVYGRFDPTNTRSRVNDPKNTAVANKHISGNSDMTESLLARASLALEDGRADSDSDENEGPYDDE